MSQNGGDASKASPPFGRPRHQIQRPISELSSPIRLRRNSPHRPSTREATTARDTRPAGPQSAVQVRRSFDWSARSEGFTPNFTPSGSRRTSLLYASADEAMMMPATKVAKDNNGLATTLAREQQRAAAQESALRRSLAELESFANTTTKQLDDTCYSFLDKLGALQTTIAGLQELTQHARQLVSSFEAEVGELDTDVGAQLDAFGNFEDQQKRIESLQRRIRVSRELIEALSERVDAVRQRIESWERADRAWQEKTRRRLKAFWVITSIVAFLILALFIASQFAPEGLEATNTTILNASDRLDMSGDLHGTAKAVILPDGHRLGGSASTGNGGLWNSTGPSSASSQASDLLRVFDEL